MANIQRREDDFRRQLDRVATFDEAEPSKVLVGRVVDGGYMPTTVPRVYLVEPDRIVVESGLVEGATPTVTATEGSVPVLVLGPYVPVDGSSLTAKLVDGVWVAGSSVQPPCPDGVVTSVTARVARYCDPGGMTPPPDLWIEDATVTVYDQSDVYPPRVGTTDANGFATIELDGPGTFTVTVDLPSPSECQQSIENVEILECQQLRLATFWPCCGEVCVDVYDYDTGDPIEGAAVNIYDSSSNDNPTLMGVTDADGRLCFRPPRSLMAGLSRIEVVKNKYFHISQSVCVDCDCDDTVTYEIALFPSSVYVPYAGPSGFVASWTTNQCPPPQDCFASHIYRYPFVYRRVMFADFAGPGPIFGGNKTGIPLTYAGNGIWEGVTTGGYGIRRRITRTGPYTWETTDTRYDFPSARVRVRFEVRYANAVEPSAVFAWLEWRNYLDEAGTIVPANGYDLGGTGESIGAFKDYFYHESICLPENIFRYYPSAILNARCLEPSDPANDQPCSEIWDQFGRVGHIEGIGADNSSPCAPVNLSGLFWCSRADICTEYSIPLSATFSLYE